MLTLNIIPDELKKENRIRSIYISLRKLMFFVILFLCIHTFLMVGAKFVLLEHYTETINESSLLSKNTANYSNQVDLINTKISYIKTIQSDSIAWSYLLEYISDKMPIEMTLNSAHFNKTNNTFTISGSSNTKQAITDFVETLSNEKYFEQVTYPQNSFWQKDNVDFEINAKIASYEFSK